MKCLDNIKKAVKWYYDLPSDYRNVELLMDARKRIAAHAFELADITGDLKKSLDNTYADRKIAQSKTKLELMEGKLSGIHAEAKATVEIKELIKEEKNYEGLYGRCRLLLTQANEVLGCLNQHISLLKNEKND